VKCHPSVLRASTADPVTIVFEVLVEIFKVPPVSSENFCGLFGLGFGDQHIVSVPKARC